MDIAPSTEGRVPLWRERGRLGRPFRSSVRPDFDPKKIHDGLNAEELGECAKEPKVFIEAEGGGYIPYIGKPAL